MLGTCVAAVALWFAANQFSQTRRSLESSTLYNLQKDGRELISSMRKEAPDVYQYVFQYNAQNESDTAYAKALPYITILIQILFRSLQSKTNRLYSRLPMGRPLSRDVPIFSRPSH
jgi:hypothetical protein